MSYLTHKQRFRRLRSPHHHCSIADLVGDHAAAALPKTCSWDASQFWKSQQEAAAIPRSHSAGHLRKAVPAAQRPIRSILKAVNASSDVSSSEGGNSRQGQQMCNNHSQGPDPSAQGPPQPPRGLSTATTRKRVRFTNTVHVVLVPHRHDMSLALKEAIWWTSEDILAARRRAWIYWQLNGRDTIQQSAPLDTATASPSPRPLTTTAAAAGTAVRPSLILPQEAVEQLPCPPHSPPEAAALRISAVITGSSTAEGAAVAAKRHQQLACDGSASEGGSSAVVDAALGFDVVSAAAIPRTQILPTTTAAAAADDGGSSSDGGGPASGSSSSSGGEDAEEEDWTGSSPGGGAASAGGGGGGPLPTRRAAAAAEADMRRRALHVASKNATVPAAVLAAAAPVSSSLKAAAAAAAAAAARFDGGGELVAACAKDTQHAPVDGGDCHIMLEAGEAAAAAAAAAATVIAV
ncbi:hypothetical protein JKP88DRAFT_263695 [Tribonema minus]|uniref:Uncharacterized protein n=1 Tax=Tribonema minus TaxID=303371 RepID=A0A835YWS6_9STRA|nr:hypothetical protein JKP88DRAFT_263695 [Tribonema minus]